MTRQELIEILESHRAWREGRGGKRADLRYADLREIDASGLDFQGVDMWGVNAEGGNFQGANMQRVDAQEGNFQGANMFWVSAKDGNFWGADMRWVNARRGNFQDADMWGVSAQGGNFQKSDMRGVDAQEGNFPWADMRGVDARRGNFRDANFKEASLDGVKIDYRTIGLQAAPEGTLIGWGKKGGKIVKLEIPADARRSCATSRKHRAEYVICLEVEGGGEAIVESEYGKTIYRPGEIVRCHEWDPDRWNECGGGIHFFLSKEEAVSWC